LRMTTSSELTVLDASSAMARSSSDPPPVGRFYGNNWDELGGGGNGTRLIRCMGGNVWCILCQHSRYMYGPNQDAYCS
jgi:hypothetical protein